MQEFQLIRMFSFGAQLAGVQGVWMLINIY